MFAQWQQQSSGNNSPECDRTYWLHTCIATSTYLAIAAIAKWEILVPYRNKLKQESLNFAPKKSRYGTKLVLLVHESSQNLRTVSKSPKVHFLMTPYFQMWNNSSYQNPKSKYQDPIFPQAQKLCIPENKIKKLDKYKIKLIWKITMSKWAKCKQKLIEEKIWAEKR
jgi:hypothetical protein